MRNRRTRNVTVLLAAGCLLAVTACGSDSKKASDTTSAGTITTEAAATTTNAEATTTTAAATGCAATKGAVVGYSEPLPDPNFAHSVILVGHHTNGGAIGWIVNRIIEPKAVGLLPPPLTRPFLRW